MPDTTLKIRVDSSDLERWRSVAGYRGLSQWIRGLCVAEILRLEREHGPVSQIRDVHDPPVAHAMPPARVLPPLPAIDPCPLCGRRVRVGEEHQRLVRGYWVACTPLVDAPAAEPRVVIESRPVCRHGLENCRICQTGAWLRVDDER